MDDLIEHWKQLKLSTEEENDIIADDDALLKELRKGENSIIGTIHIDRHISMDVLRTTMAKI